MLAVHDVPALPPPHPEPTRLGPALNQAIGLGIITDWPRALRAYARYRDGEVEDRGSAGEDGRELGPHAHGATPGRPWSWMGSEECASSDDTRRRDARLVPGDPRKSRGGRVSSAACSVAERSRHRRHRLAGASCLRTRELVPVSHRATSAGYR
jgi:hypothetical protein